MLVFGDERGEAGGDLRGGVGLAVDLDGGGEVGGAAGALQDVHRAVLGVAAEANDGRESRFISQNALARP